MSDWLSFEGQVEPVEWGRSTYTVLRLPPEIAETLQRLGAKRVEGEINEHPVNLALTRAPVVEGVFLWAGQSLLDQVGIAPMERVEVRLRPAPDDLVDTPPDLEAAVQRAGLWAGWERLTASKRRGLIYKVATAKTRPTRDKRIAELVQKLEDGAL